MASKPGPVCCPGDNGVPCGANPQPGSGTLVALVVPGAYVA